MANEIIAKSIDLKAAADYLGTGAIEVPIFEREIVDIIRRESIALQRIQHIEATGHPHRYIEQTAIASAAAVDPRNLSATPSGPVRVERPLFIKAVTAQSNLSLFDKNVTEQQGQFASVVAKDVDDIISAIVVKTAKMLWAGSDTSLLTPTTYEWMGILAQITGAATSLVTVAAGASIIDAIKTAVATMIANQTYVVRPTAIYMNPVMADYIDQEAKAAKYIMDTMEVVAGVTVGAIATQAGKLPIIGEPFIPTDTGANYGFSAPPSGNQNYYIVITVEKEIEIPVISGANFDPKPRLFQLGLTGNLAGQFVGVEFSAVVAKAAAYAHTVLCVNRA